jgi:hypothetical protein
MTTEGDGACVRDVAVAGEEDDGENGLPADGAGVAEAGAGVGEPSIEYVTRIWRVVAVGFRIVILTSPELTPSCFNDSDSAEDSWDSKVAVSADVAESPVLAAAKGFTAEFRFIVSIRIWVD